MVVSYMQENDLIQTRDQWYWLVHKSQYGAFAIAWMLYVSNPVNRFSRNLYVGFFVLNGILYEAIRDHYDWRYSALIFAVLLIVIIVIERSRNGDS